MTTLSGMTDMFGLDTIQQQQLVKILAYIEEQSAAGVTSFPTIPYDMFFGFDPHEAASLTEALEYHWSNPNSSTPGYTLSGGFTDNAAILNPLSDSVSRALGSSSPLYAAVIGDSIDEGFEYSFFSRLCMLSNQRLRFYVNAGVGGENTTQMLARIQADVIAWAPRVCVLGSTTNDYTANFTKETTRGNIHAMVTLLRKAGITPILRTTTPINNAGAGAYNTVALRRAAVQAHNSWITQYAAENDIELLDVYTPLADASGGYQVQYTDDGTHPNAAGSDYVAGLLATNAIQAIESAAALTLVQSSGEANLFPSGYITTTTGWSTTGSPTVTLDTSYTGAGDAYRMAITTASQLTQRSIMAATITPLVGRNLELSLGVYGQGCQVTVQATQRDVGNATISTHYLVYQMTLIAGRLYIPRASFQLAANCSNVLFTVRSAGTIAGGAYIAFGQVTGRESPVGGE